MTAKPTVMTVYGTRPEAIKVAPIVKALDADSRFQSIVVTTGQHREMLDQVNTMFRITPDHDLGIMRHGQTLNGIVARVITGLDELLEAEAPDLVLVHGDTSTAMAAAVAAFNRGVAVAHVEAGLRTDSLRSPFPEEGNRRLITRLAALNLAPTQTSRDNLLRENVPSETIVVTGNTVIDALVEAATWETRFTDDRLAALEESSERIVLVTTHRRENFDAMTAIGRAMGELARRYPDVKLVLPAHLNPRVRDAVFPEIEDHANVIITEPLPYSEFTKLMSLSTVVLTDSGGVQEEAPSLGKPVLVMRRNTERPEAVVAGTVKLIGTEQDAIVAHTSRLLDDDAEFARMAGAVNPYGDGGAAARSIAAIAALLGVGERLADFQAGQLTAQA